MEKFYTLESFKKIPNYSDVSIVFGGTFDPIHQGHIIDIKKLIEISNSVYLAPTHQNPWKMTNPSPLEMRIEMISLTLAAENISYELINDETILSESKNTQVKIITTPYTYAVDVLKTLGEQDVTNLFWAIGEDLIDSASKWMDWEEFGVPFIVLPLIDGYSATFVREKSIEPHSAIREFIQKNSLYKG